MNKKNIRDWKYILLDTSFIIDYLSDPERFTNNPKKKDNIELAKKIMDLLSSELRETKPLFYVTSITLGELQKLESASGARMILNIFNACDVSFLSYGKKEAEILGNTVLGWRKQKQPKVALKQIEEECKKNGISNFRLWISDDMKILSCAKVCFNHKRLDVILTSDEKTFLPIAEYMELPCMVVKKENFPTDLFGEL